MGGKEEHMHTISPRMHVLTSLTRVSTLGRNGKKEKRLWINNR